jgi:hypothetical protein
LCAKNLVFAELSSALKSRVSLVDFPELVLVLEATKIKVSNDAIRALMHSFCSVGTLRISMNKQGYNLYHLLYRGPWVSSSLIEDVSMTDSVHRFFCVRLGCLANVQSELELWIGHMIVKIDESAPRACMEIYSEDRKEG